MGTKAKLADLAVGAETPAAKTMLVNHPPKVVRSFRMGTSWHLRPAETVGGELLTYIRGVGRILGDSEQLLNLLVRARPVVFGAVVSRVLGLRPRAFKSALQSFDFGEKVSRFVADHGHHANYAVVSVSRVHAVLGAHYAGEHQQAC